MARGKVPRAADLEARWGYSKHDGWVLGYGDEVVVTAGKAGVEWPLMASVSVASEHPCHSFPSQISQLPEGVQSVLADAGYDSNAFAEQVENTPSATRRYLCPQINRRGARQASGKAYRRTAARQESERRRRERREYFERPAGRQLFRRRSASVEPFNEWLKSKFHLQHRVWHRRLNNNRTQILAAIFTYQLLLVFNHLPGRANGQIQWILDAL